MPIIDELLAGDEHIRYVGRQHLFVLVGSVLTELLLVAVLIAAGVASQAAFANQVIGSWPVGQLVMLVCLGIGLLVLASAGLDYLRWNNEQYIITDQRVIQLRGIFNIQSLDSSLEKINDIELRQSWLGRLFDFGDIEILTGSDAGVNYFRRIAHPLDFKRAMLQARSDMRGGFGYLDQDAVEAYLDHGARSPRAESSDEIGRTLQQLADLRDRGVLSDEEFETKKRDLLSRI